MEKEIILNTITSFNGELKESPSKIVLHPKYIEFNLNFKYSRDIRIETGDSFLDELSPKYETLKGDVVETVYMERSTIQGLSASEKESSVDGVKVGVIQIESPSTQMFLTMNTYEEARNFVNLLKDWKFEN
jgi:hypothetical protein